MGAYIKRLTSSKISPWPYGGTQKAFLLLVLIQFSVTFKSKF